MTNWDFDDVRKSVAAILAAFCIGWSSKVVSLLTDPIVSVATQFACRIGWIGILFVVMLVLKQMHDDYKGYVAMGVFSVPAIVTYLLPWDAATFLMAFSAAGLSYLGKGFFRGLFKV